MKNIPATKLSDHIGKRVIVEISKPGNGLVPGTLVVESRVIETTPQVTLVGYDEKARKVTFRYDSGRERTESPSAVFEP